MSGFNSLNNEKGTTLVEMTIAVGVSSILILAASSAWDYFKKSSAKAARMESVSNETEEIVQSLQKSWDIRKRPAGYVSNFTATNKGFELLTSSGDPCTSNCPRIEIPIERQNGAMDTVRITTSCVDPGAISAKARLGALDFASALTSGCMVCSGGNIPVVTFTSNTSTGEAKRFPRNGSKSAKNFRINDILGFNTCFEHSGTGPLLVTIVGVTLGDSVDEKKLKSFSRTMTLPFDNFANIRLKSKK